MMAHRSLDIICRTAAHCRTCREDSESGSRFRNSLRAVYQTPDDWPSCPHGLIMGYRPLRVFGYRIRGVGDIVTVVTSWLGLQKCGGCQQRETLFNKWTSIFFQKKVELKPQPACGCSKE